MRDYCLSLSTMVRFLSEKQENELIKLLTKEQSPTMSSLIHETVKSKALVPFVEFEVLAWSMIHQKWILDQTRYMHRVIELADIVKAVIEIYYALSERPMSFLNEKNILGCQDIASPKVPSNVQVMPAAASPGSRK